MRIKCAALLLCAIAGYASAQVPITTEGNGVAPTKISQLPVAGPLNGTEPMPIVQSGSCVSTSGTCQTNPAAFIAYLESAGAIYQWLPSLVTGDCLSNNGTALLWATCGGGGGGGGTVTSVSASVPSGLSVSVSNPTTTPAINITTALNGILLGTGSGFSTASSSNIISLWSGTCNSTTYLRADGTCQPASGGSGGTVTSVGLTMPSWFTVSGSPVTDAGTFSVTANSQSQNLVLASPNGSSGTPAFRALVSADIPTTLNSLTSATSLAAVGTVTAGTWNASVVAPLYGGSGEAGTITGILKGNGTSAYSAAASLDVTSLWSGTCNSTTYLRGDGSCQAPAGSGTVSSVGLSAPSVFSVSGSPVTGTGTLALTFASGQTQNEFLATPNGSSGAVSLRAIVAADLPGTITSSTTGNAATATALAATPTQCSSQLATGIAASGNANCYALGTGVYTALGVNVGSAGAVVVNGGAGGTPSSLTLSNATGLPLTTGVTGQLPVANGGTGLSSATAHDLLIGNGTSALTLLGPSTASGVPLLSQGSSSNPAYGAINLAGGSSIVSGLLPVANGGTGTSSPGIVAGTNITVTGSWPNQTVSATAGGTVNSGTANQLGYYASTGTAISGLTLGNNFTISSGVLGSTAPVRTAASPTVASTDMGGQINVSSGTITVPAISSSIFAPGMTLTLVNYSGSTEAISTTPTINSGGGCVSGTGIPAGDSWQMIGNSGGTIDCIQTVSAGGGGSGTVTTTGSPANAQLAVFSGSTSITGTSAATLSSGILSLGASGTLGSVQMGNATSGTVTLEPVTGALGTVTASLPANTGTLAELNLAQTFSALQTFSGGVTNSKAGAASTPAATFSGAPYTGGTGTTTFPLLYLNSGATAPTTFSTSGTFLGINAPSGFTGRLADFYINGTEVAKLSTYGNLTSIPVAAATATSVTPNCEYGFVKVTTSATGTFTINAPTTCTPVDGQRLELKIINTGGATAYSWNGAYIASATLALPSAPNGSSEEDYFAFQYDADKSAWAFLAANQGF